MALREPGFSIIQGYPLLMEPTLKHATTMTALLVSRTTGHR